MLPVQPPELEVPPDAACLGCGYSLQHLTLPRCPECGSKFDPCNPRTMRLPGRWLHRALAAMVPIAVWAAVTFPVAFALIAVDIMVGQWRWITPVPAIAVASMVGLVCRRWFRDWLMRDRPDAALDADRRATRWLMASLLLLGLYYAPRSITCPHSSYHSLGPYTLVWTNDPTCRRLPGTPPHWVSSRLVWYDQREPAVPGATYGY